LAIFGYNFLEQNTANIKASPVDGVVPTAAAISDGRYSLARSLYIYVKGEHLGKVPGLAEFVREILCDAASGSDGYLALKGLLPLPEALHKVEKAKAATL
jgi:phosphate transport system substrate-binding protein